MSTPLFSSHAAFHPDLVAAAPISETERLPASEGKSETSCATVSEPRFPGPLLSVLPIGPFVELLNVSPDSSHRRRSTDKGIESLLSPAWNETSKLANDSAPPDELLATRAALASRNAELTATLDHVTQIYQHLSLSHKVARALQSKDALDDVLRLIMHDLPETISADSVGLHVPGSDHHPPVELVYPENCRPWMQSHLALLQRTTSERDVLVSSFNRAEHPLRAGQGGIVAARVNSNDGRKGWLVAVRRQGKFGSEEGQLLQSLANIFAGQLETALLLREKDAMLLSMIRSFVSALEARDHYTRGHSERVADVAAQLARGLGMTPASVSQIHLSGLLHDVGKIGVSDNVLRKSGPLNEADWIEIRQHPVIGYNILKEIAPFKGILPGVRSHHEAFDGSGYPDQLAGDQIPFMARILAVADAFDAMSSNRVYRVGKSPEDVDAILQSGAGEQWDPGVVTVFLNMRQEIRQAWNEQFAGH